MSSYEETRQRHLGEAMARLPEHVERLTWPAERLFEERTRLLRDLLRVAKEKSPWHRARLAEVDPAAMDEGELPRLPAMTKDDLMDHWDEIVTVDGVTLDRVEVHLERIDSDAYLDGTLHACASGGSSGRRGVFLYDWEAWLLDYLGFARHIIRDRMTGTTAADGPPVLAVIAADRPTHQTSSLAQTFSSPIVRTHRFPITLPLAHIVAGLNQTQPTTLTGYSSGLFLLAHEALAGRLRIAPQTVTVTSEPLLPEMRRAFETAWGCPVGNWWGSSEGGPTGVSCYRAAGVHLSDDLLIIEPVDSAGQPVPPGVRADKVYLTNLFNPATPLIRYELTDEVTLLDEPCPCGSTHRRVDDIQGRHDDMFVYGDVHVHPIAFRSPLGRRPEIVEYQVRQTPEGADITISCTGPVDDVDIEALQTEIANELANTGVATPHIEIVTVDSFERQTSGKLKRFFPLPLAG